MPYLRENPDRLAIWLDKRTIRHGWADIEHRQK
ncbi:hypothetical protein [Yersinia alsatica]